MNWSNFELFKVDLNVIKPIFQYLQTDQIIIGLTINEM